MKVILHSHQYTRRGDTVNARNIANGLSLHYGIDSILCAPREGPSDPEVLRELASEGIKVELYGNQRDLQKISENNKVTHSYFMKSGLYDGDFVYGIPNFVHAVFRDFQPHGDVYAFASRWLYENVRSKPDFVRWYRHYPKWALIKQKSKSPYFPDRHKKIDWLPHITNLPIADSNFDIRERLGISSTCKIVSRLGGKGDFNDPAGHEAVKTILRNSKSISFVFVNTEEFYQHPRLHYLNKYISEEEKASLIASSSLMLNCRLRGESFGHSICESLFMGVPIIAPAVARNPLMDAHHADILGGSDLLYESASDLVAKIYENLDTPRPSDELKLLVKDFGSMAVTKRFYEMFLSKTEF
jgi:hypothetical protein